VIAGISLTTVAYLLAGLLLYVTGMLMGLFVAKFWR